jgi:hypothetical protein
MKILPLFIDRPEVYLVVDGWRYHCTTENKAECDTDLANLQKAFPNRALKKREYYVDIHKVDREQLVTSWSKKPGYSIWYQ